MNPRIKQLADQCYCVTTHADLEQFDKEKFAQLIVEECARIARATPCPYEEDEVRQRLGHTWDMASLEAGREIVKHFGVEE
jgi:tellurite resistance protein